MQYIMSHVEAHLVEHDLGRVLAFYWCRHYGCGIGDDKRKNYTPRHTNTGPLLSQSLVSSPVLGCIRQKYWSTILLV